MNTNTISFNQLLSNIITQIVNPIIMLLAGAAFILFLYEVYQLIRNGGGDTGLADAKRGILWSLIGLVIIFGVFGILNIVTSTFHLNKVQRISNSTSSTVIKYYRNTETPPGYIQK